MENEFSNGKASQSPLLIISNWTWWTCIGGTLLLRDALMSSHMSHSLGCLSSYSHPSFYSCLLGGIPAARLCSLPFPLRSQFAPLTLSLPPVPEASVGWRCAHGPMSPGLTQSLAHAPCSPGLSCSHWVQLTSRQFFGPVLAHPWESPQAQHDWGIFDNLHYHRVFSRGTLGDWYFSCTSRSAFGGAFSVVRMVTHFYNGIKKMTEAFHVKKEVTSAYPVREGETDF